MSNAVTAMMMRHWARAALAVVLAVLSGPALAGACRDTSFDGAAFSVCEVGAGQDLRLFLNGHDEQALGSFAAVDDLLAPEGRHLIFAMNAGMYRPDRSPVGLYVENGHQTNGLQRKASSGNFGLQPNGVFCIGADGFQVAETLAFDAARPDCRYATQSGPMLVIGGKLHPKFMAGAPSVNIRNGVGVSADGRTAFFVISDDLVNFDLFARFFRDGLGVPNALFLDGTISRLYAPELGRDDFGFPMGPIVGLVGAPG